jgi:hypothetical protein
VAELTITATNARGGPTFEFATRAGSAPRVRSVVVFDSERQTHCWLIAAGIYGGADPRRELDARLRGAGLSIPPDVDPIEDLSPLDPRYRIAEHRLLDEVEASHPELRRLVYGKLPAGFHQVLPHEGNAVALEPGRRYELRLFGSSDDEVGSVQFEAL